MRAKHLLTKVEVAGASGCSPALASSAMMPLLTSYCCEAARTECKSCSTTSSPSPVSCKHATTIQPSNGLDECDKLVGSCKQCIQGAQCCRILYSQKHHWTCMLCFRLCRLATTLRAMKFFLCKDAVLTGTLCGCLTVRELLQSIKICPERRIGFMAASADVGTL